MSKGVIPCTLLSQQRKGSHGAFASNLCWRPLLAGSNNKRHSWGRGSSLSSSACSGFFLHSEDVDMAVSVHTCTCTKIHTCFQESSRTQPHVEWKCDCVCTVYVVCVGLSAVCLHLINTCVKTGHSTCSCTVTLHVIDPEKHKKSNCFFLKEFPRRQNSNSNLLHNSKNGRKRSNQLGRAWELRRGVFVHTTLRANWQREWQNT